MSRSSHSEISSPKPPSEGIASSSVYEETLETEALLSALESAKDQENSVNNGREPGQEARVRFTSSVFSGDNSPNGTESISSVAGADATENGETNPVRSFWYILLLTVVIGGLQLSWSAEFSNGTVSRLFL